MGYRIIYDDEIYHSHKYVAKVNNGSKPKYFYTAEAYRAYINGKKNTAVAGLKTTAAIIKAARKTKDIPAGDRIEANIEYRAKRAGLKTEAGWVMAGHAGPNVLYKEASDSNGNKYLISSKDRKIYAQDGKMYGNSKQVMTDADNGKGKDESKSLIKKEKHKNDAPSRSNPTSSNRPKSREKNVTNDGKGAKKGSSASTTAGPIDEREELFNEVKAFIKSRKKKKK